MSEKTELKAQLDELGVVYSPRATNDILRAELEAALAAAEPKEEVPVVEEGPLTRKVRGEISSVTLWDDGTTSGVTVSRVGDDGDVEAETLSTDNYASACSTAFRLFHDEARKAGAF